MELVYLYVEKYKNIQKQGFNFSSRFTCKYDEDKKELKIDENKNYIENFFADNINITAIVGENGSGKSNILELIHMILLDKCNDEKLFYLLVARESDNNYYMSSSNLIISTTIRKKTLKEFSKKISYISRNTPMDYKNNDIENLICLDDKSINNQISLVYNEVGFELSSFMYLPEKMEVKPNIDDILESILGENTSLNFVSEEIYNRLSQKNNITNNDDYDESDVVSELNIDYNDKLHRFLVILFFPIINSNEQLIDKEELIKKLDKAEVLINSANFYNYFTKRTINLKTLTNIEKEIYFNHYNKFFIFDFIDSKNRRYSNLSEGEKKIYGLLLNIYTKSLDKENTNIANVYAKRPDGYTINFLLDEPDNSLHPNWQKKFLLELIVLLKKIKNRYNLILTSHSPFILSDIPKQNIVFLKEGKQVDALEKKQTFGANIHTLLADGFFMDGGLMGEFAKAKIEEVIKYLNGEKSEIKSKEEAQKIINIIGEPILKYQLQKMLDSKRRDKIDELEDEIEFLKHRIEILRKNQ